ncbi:MAG: carbon-nitrogen hydrolase [Verrucomicrobiales bacterium]
MNSPKNVSLALIQLRCGVDRQDNLERTIGQIRHAAQQGANIIGLQELFQGHYFCQTEDHKYFDWAEPIPGPTTETLCKIAAECQVVLVASLFEKRAPGLYHNTAAIINADGTLLGKYRKMHIPDDPLFYEKFYFTPGDLGFRAWDTAVGRIGVCVCWDQWYPEAARATALRGAQIIFYPTAIGWHPSEKAEHGEQQRSAWQIIQRSHAVANGCFIAVTNRVGHEAPDGGDGIEFWGSSFVTAPGGQVLAEASIDQEDCLICSLDMKRVETFRTHWPFLRDRRIDAYADLNQRWIDT